MAVSCAELLLQRVRGQRRIGDDRHLDQRRAIARPTHNVRSEGRGHPHGRGVDHDEQAIEDAAQRVLRGEREVGLGAEKGIDGRRYCATAAVSEDHDDLQAAAQVVDRVLEAAEHFAAEAIPATRTTKRSFGPSLKISSIGTRASEQPSTAA